mmetsp:Transcript_19891/g.36702  ORF Transcript_19891/g.36702 Transcript_19891/m.36702 type:complete len:186 (-) Transcript_19891:1014-1571(-)
MSRRPVHAPSHLLNCSDDDEERKASTTRLDAFPRYTYEEVAPINSTPKKPVPLDPSYLVAYEDFDDIPVPFSQESLTSGLSSLTTRSSKRRYNDTRYSTKRYKGEASEIKCLNSEFVNKKTGEVQYFRCYYEHEVVAEAVAKDAKLAVNIYDDDCDTDDEQISQAAALVKRQLQDAILVARSNLM